MILQHPSELFICDKVCPEVLAYHEGKKKKKILSDSILVLLPFSAKICKWIVPMRA